jgi:chromate transporter
MSLLVLYLLLLKATMTSFSGLAPLAMVRADLVVKYGVLTDRQLNTAVAAGRMGPGPVGLWIVSVGYFVGGVPGACVATLAMVTPAFLIIPLLRRLGARAAQPRVRSMIQAATIAAAGLIISIMVGLSQDAITDHFSLAVAVASFIVLVATRLDTLWVIAAAAVAGLVKTLLFT